MYDADRKKHLSVPLSAILPGFPVVVSGVRTKQRTADVPLNQSPVSLSTYMMGEAPESPSSMMPPGTADVLLTVSRPTVTPLLYLPNVERPRMVRVAPMIVRLPLVTSRTVESEPSPIVVSEVIRTALLTMAMSPAPGGVEPPQVARLDQSPDRVLVTVRRGVLESPRLLARGSTGLFCPLCCVLDAPEAGTWGVPP